MSTEQINANSPKINIINSGGGVLDARCTASEDDCDQIKLKRNAGRIDQEHLDNDILRQPPKRLRTDDNDHQNHHHNHYHHQPEEETNNNQLNENVTTNPEEMASAQCPQIGKPAPQFKNMAVVNGQFKEISLSDYKGKYVVLFFYPMDFTFVCPTEIIAFSDRADEFRKVNCEVIAASTDSHYTHLAWVNTPRKEGGLGQMNIPLLADKTGQVSRDYGVYIESQGIPLRGLFIIDDKQNLRQITINDLPVGRNVDETIRLVQAFQYTDVHGEVCPANWKPGSATIKPSVESSKEYFSKNN